MRQSLGGSRSAEELRLMDAAKIISVLMLKRADNKGERKTGCIAQTWRRQSRFFIVGCECCSVLF